MIKTNESLIRFKTTKSLDMDYIVESGDILLTVVGKMKGFESDHYVIQIPKRQIYPLLRGLISYTQRFWRRHAKRSLPKKTNA